ncbi:acyltransferase family protein [Schlesneria sp. T3-172]|uniref:acyltransferase family protein n=1 Tax=Schlesneria sphaerica TaxID=3373610 RepID=UPI0037C7078B
MSSAVEAVPAKPASGRLASLDAYRGFVMICLAANGFGLAAAARNFPDCSIFQAIGYQFEHVAWVGCAFWDLIQPSFMFLVGVAVPYSLTRREAQGESSGKLVTHVLIRSLVLILLGIFLSSGGQPVTNFTFMNVLTQIGLGYPFLFLLRNRGLAIQVAAAVLVLVAYWAWFALTPVKPVDDPKDIHLPENWTLLTGFEAHWQKNANPAATFDRWFLNIFPPAKDPAREAPTTVTGTEGETDEGASGESAIEPARPGLLGQIGAVLRRLVTRPEPYVFNSGGYQTLNFIPSFVTMLIGLMTGEFIRRNSGQHARVFKALLTGGLVLCALGWGIHALGVCPLVKRIWTPSWTLFSSGLTLLMLSGFYGIIDGLGWKAWSFPLVVAGMNSMVLYLSGQLLRGWTADLLKRHINDDLFNIFGEKYAPIVQANLVLLCFWLFVYWLYRQRVFIRV